MRSTEIITVHDSFVDTDEKELYLCEIDNGDLIWLNKDDIDDELLVNFEGAKPPEDNDPCCNTSKDMQYKCNIKSRTRGLQIACTNCGFIIAYREMFCSESSSQVAMLYLDIAENAKGNFYK